MTAKKLTKAAFRGFVNSLIASVRVDGVVARGDKFAFGPLESAEDLRLDYDVTILPPKKYFQPPQETLLTFSRDGEFEPVHETEPLVLLGVHPYDLVAINQMDTIFSSDNYDAHYMARRASTRIIACDAKNGSPSCFAASMGTTRVDKGFDLFVTDIGDAYVVEIGTEEGEKMLREHAPDVQDAGPEDIARRDAERAEADKRLAGQELGFPAEEIPRILEGAEDHPIFEEKAKLCFACGSCNLVCPTCYCFDVHDEVEWDLASGKRHRAWDGCLLRDFAAVAGGHNFRKNRADRFRHRIYRKGKYIYDKIGQLGCVGCGRCASACVPDVANPVPIFRAIKGVE